jgi:hypothetical protein
VFLSIGYGACHWCTVMGAESFADPVVAARLNAGFVPVLVDREAEPQVDETYRAAVTLMAGTAGWPLTVFLAPDGRPFYGATYLPRERLLALLDQVRREWARDPGALQAQAGEIAQAVATYHRRLAPTALSAPAISAAVRQGIVTGWDRVHGGNQGLPKFPHPTRLLLLLALAEQGDAEALALASDTVSRLLASALYDQIGGGFHRYAEDAEWRRPHFEKMLVDQALMALVLQRAHRLTGGLALFAAAGATLTATLRDFALPEGGYATALAADSGGVEGGYYRWTDVEWRAALGPEAALADRLFLRTPLAGGGATLSRGIPLEDLAEAEEKEDASGRWVKPPDRWVEDTGRIPIRGRLQAIPKRLLAARLARPAPAQDAQAVLGENALFALALLECGFEEEGARLLRYIEDHFRLPGGGYGHRWAGGAPQGTALLEDLAGLGLAALAAVDRAAVTGAAVDGTVAALAGTVAGVLRRGLWDGAAGRFRRAPTEAATPPFVTGQAERDELAPAPVAQAALFLGRLARRGLLPGDASVGQWVAAARTAATAGLAAAPAEYATLGLAALEAQAGEGGALAYGAAGHLRAAAWGRRQLAVEIALAPGWRIQAAHPREPGLVGTQLTLAEGARGLWLGPVSYPEPVERRLSFRTGPLALYEGTVRLTAMIGAGTQPPAMGEAPGEIQAGAPGQWGLLPLALRYQACDDRTCLPPETLILRLPPNPPLEHAISQ